jgi:hypothetical protein
LNSYWGDLHNHCGITYGYGSQKNALLRAAAQLDFCAVTGHAMWPDIYARNEETAFTIDFHREGFEKLRAHWEEVRTEIAAANSEKLVTFQAYEMHSSRYGDHHIVSPEDGLPLIYRDSPAALLRDAGVRALTVAHHIGYTPGYRGISWEEHDDAVTPLVEVCSKHGCAMNETAAFPYYHNMGPRDSRNTVYEGLRRGFRFGFVGSTDHHAGYPGSYGDGKLAVLADRKDRESIWQALMSRRTFAVTGERIDCRFAVNGMPMGSILPHGSGERRIEWSVKGGYNLGKVVIYKNLLPIGAVYGEQLSPNLQAGRYKFRIEMGWGNNDKELFPWQGRVSVSGGRLIGAEPCFRGRSVLAPSKERGSAQEDINDIDNRILSLTDSVCEWQCFTLKNQTTLHPATCAVIFEVEGAPDTGITIEVNGHRSVKTVSQLAEYGYSEQMKPWHSQAFKVHPVITEAEYTASGTLIDQPGPGRDFYHMEVTQLNGHCAYVTPVYFD